MRRRRNPVENEISWTPLLLWGGVALAAYWIYEKWIGGCNTVHCANVAANPQGNVILPCGSSVPVANGQASCCHGQVLFCYGGTRYYLNSPHNACGNYQASGAPANAPASSAPGQPWCCAAVASGCVVGCGGEYC